MESTKAVADFYAEAKVRSAERFNSSSSSEEWNAIPFGALFPDCLGQTQNDVAEEFDPLFQASDGHGIRAGTSPNDSHPTAHLFSGWQARHCS
jgi:hypothetical protein